MSDTDRTTEPTDTTPVTGVNGSAPTTVLEDDAASTDGNPLAAGLPDDDEEENLYVDPNTCYHLHERLVLQDGTEHTRRGAMFETEPHLGDVMDTAGFKVISLLAQAKADGYLRWVSDIDGLFFTPYENVSGIHVDVFDPDDNEISGEELKPGRQKPADGR